MITLFIFYCHTVAGAAIYTKRWQDADWKEGVMGVAFLALVFSVGWSISTFFVKMVVNERGIAKWLDRDTISLLLLMVIEGIFFYVQILRRRRRALATPAA
jgi:uncharacterized membrane protein YhaH (DUF805 family)